MAAGALLVAPAWAAPSAQFAYVGCRTSKERNARGLGIEVFQVNATGAWSHVQRVAGLDNPSFLAFDREQRFLYAVHGDLSDISAFSIDPATGMLTLLNRQSTEGRNPAHLLIDASGRYILVANYATGSVAVLPRNADGSLGAGTSGGRRFRHAGSEQGRPDCLPSPRNRILARWPFPDRPGQGAGPHLQLYVRRRPGRACAGRGAVRAGSARAPGRATSLSIPPRHSPTSRTNWTRRWAHTGMTRCVGRLPPFQDHPLDP